jgi:uncharacterized protein (TIGR00725 family)
MKTRIGVMGSASESGSPESRGMLIERGQGLATAIAKRQLILLTGATTGIVYLVGKDAHEAGVLHIGISPASNEREHIDQYKLPLDACDLLVYTGFGLKGRNVVLVRSCDIVVFIAGAMGSLNEFTIAHDEGKIIGCLTGTGGVADESEYLANNFGKRNSAQVVREEDPERLLDLCIEKLALEN